MSVYLKTEVSGAVARQLAQHVRGRAPASAGVTLITAAQALEEFRTQSGFGAALDALDRQSAAERAAVRPAADATRPSSSMRSRRVSGGLARSGLGAARSRLGAALRRDARSAAARAAGSPRRCWVPGWSPSSAIPSGSRSRTARAEIEVTQLVGGSQRASCAGRSCTPACSMAWRGALAWPGGASRPRRPRALAPRCDTTGADLWQPASRSQGPACGLDVLLGARSGWAAGLAGRLAGRRPPRFEPKYRQTTVT